MAKKKDKKQQSLKKAVQSAGKNLSQSEAKKIAKQTGKSVAQVTAKATNMNIGVGAKLANQISSALATPGSSQAQNLGITRASTNTREALSGLSGVNLNKGQVYQGAYTTRTPATSQNLGSGYGVRTTTSSSQVNPIIGTRQPKTKDKNKGPYDGAFDLGAAGPSGGLTEQQIQDLINAGIQTGIDDYISQYGLGADNQDQSYLDLIAGMGDMFSSQMGTYQQSMADQMAMMNQFAAPQEMARMYGAGQNYNIDAIRAAQRNQQRRTGYLRGRMGIGGGGTSASALSGGLGLGSALGTLGGVSI